MGQLSCGADRESEETRSSPLLFRLQEGAAREEEEGHNLVLPLCSGRHTCLLGRSWHRWHHGILAFGRLGMAWPLWQGRWIWRSFRVILMKGENILLKHRGGLPGKVTEIPFPNGHNLTHSLTHMESGEAGDYNSPA